MMQHYNNIKIFRRRYTLLLPLLLCCSMVFAQTFTVQTLLDNGNRPNRIKLAYMGDGYTAAQQAAFITNTTTINNALFGQAPFSNYKNFFHAYAIQVPSAETGAKHPATASDEASSNGQPVANPNNYIGSTFDYASIHRLLVPNTGTANSILANNVADYNQGFVVVNSTYYGGSGGPLATSSVNTSANEIAIHEIGHSFAGLADEYWAGDQYAAERPNMTQNTNPATVKWKNWIGTNGIGIYAHGSSGNQAIWFKPHQSCKMQFLNSPFCAVCSERIIDRIHQLVNMIDSYLPTTLSFNLTNTNPVSFSVAHLQTTPATIQVRWYLNGSTTPFATGQSSVNIPYSSFVQGSNTVRAEVLDNTTLSRSYLPGAGYTKNVTWTVNATAVTCNAPSAPAVTSLGANMVGVSWAGAGGAQSYTVDYKAAASSSWINALPATTGTAAVFSGLASNTVYDWRVRTNCAGSSSTYLQAQFTTAPASACGPNIIITTPISSAYRYQALQFITASSTVTAASPQTVDFVAGNYVEMQPGFMASSTGGSFSAYTGACTSAPPAPAPIPLVTTPGAMVEIFPNPFSSSTTIRYRVTLHGSPVSIAVFSAAGNRIAVIKQDTKAAAGTYSAEWKTGQLPPGIYLLEIVINGQKTVHTVTKL
jgi:IgA Peptidase M64/Secretion system C-terminal sorting domain